MEVLIVGAGAMGSLFSRYLSGEHGVSVYDTDRSKMEELSRRLGVRPLRKLERLSEYDSALVCIPISRVPSVVRVLSRGMRGGSVIMEISSVKSPVIGAMRELKPMGILGISFHPLFGPGLRDLSSGRAAVIEVAELEEEVSYLSSLFPFKLIPMGLEEHDRAMAWLGLVHLMANAFLSSSDEQAGLLSSASTTTISWFLKVALATLTQGESLSQELITQNPYFEDCLRRFLSDLESRDFKGIRGKIKRWLEEMDPGEAYKLLYTV